MKIILTTILVFLTTYLAICFVRWEIINLSEVNNGARAGYLFMSVLFTGLVFLAKKIFQPDDNK